jgi:DNA ligase-1
MCHSLFVYLDVYRGAQFVDGFISYRRFFGSNGNTNQAPKKQTTLAFGGKRQRASSSAADEDVKQNIHDAKEEEGTGAVPSTPVKGVKREKSPEAEESDGSDVQPVSKRRRKASAPSSPAAKKQTPSPKKPKTTKPKTESPSPKPATKEDTSADMSAVENSTAEISKEEEVESEEEEDLKPELKKKSIEKFQAKLQGSGKDPYPDWIAGEPVPYAALCTTFSLVEMTRKRLEITDHCSLFLRQVLRLTPADFLSTVQLMINKLAADYAGIELGIGESLIMKAIGESTGRSLAVIKADQKEIGDLGLVAAKSRGNQPTMFKPKPLTVRGVHEGLLAIAQVQGHGSQDKKISGIKKLLSAADAATAGKGGKGVDITKDKGGASEAKFIIRFLEGKLRLGLAEKTVLVAVARAVQAHEAESKGEKMPSTEKMVEGENIFKTVYSELPAYEVIIPAILEHGLFKLPEVCKLSPGVPLKPMLAKPTKSITEVLDRFEGKEFTCEYKYDGERAQIHFVSPDSIHQYPSAKNTLQKDSKGLCSIFSRNSEDLSKKYPDVLAKLDTWVKDDVKSFVLDCETVAWDTVNKKVLPFQQLMTRKRKDVKADEVTVKVCVFAFDLLFFNGEVRMLVLIPCRSR